MDNDLADRVHAVSYRLRLCTRYHQRRARFFDMSDLWIKASSVLFGAGAIAGALGSDSVVWPAVVVTITSTLSLVFRFEAKAFTR
jgi:hypothetical protein